jgi:hypothetical protein
MSKKYIGIICLFIQIFTITACDYGKPTISIITVSPIKTQIRTSVIATKHTDTPNKTPTLTSTINPCINGLISPDEKYIAREKYDKGNILIEGIVICDSSGTIIWTIQSQLVKPTGSPHPDINVYRWSPDSLYLYFRYYYLPDGGDFAFFWDGFDLQSFNIKTGFINNVIPIKGFVSFSFSPDYLEIAYIPEEENPHNIHIRNVTTGIEKKTNIDRKLNGIVQLGNIHWYSDGTKLAFQIETSDYWIYTYYLNKDTMQLLLVNDYRLYALEFQGWTDDGKLKFMDYEKKEIFFIDPQSGKTSKVTPIPISRN